MAEIRDTLILDIDAALRQVQELENALNRALSEIVLDVNTAPAAAELEELDNSLFFTADIDVGSGVEQLALDLDDAADDAARLDRELDQADSSADDLADEMGDVAKAADRAADETERIDKAGKDATKSFGKLGEAVKKGLSFKELGITAVAAVGIREIAQFAVQAVTAATDLSESINAVEVIFGEASETILQFGADTSDAVFLAASEFNQLAAVTGTLLQGFGIGVQDAADITLVLGQRAADLASVFNTEVATALDAINAALRGETEQIRRFTGSFSIEEVTRFGRELFDVTGKLSSQQQALAAVEFILQKTAAVQGDAAATAGELANQQRALNEVWTNAQAAIGQALVPAIESLLPLVFELIEVVEDLVPVFEVLAPVVAGLVAEVVGLVSPLVDLFSLIGGLAELTGQAEEGTSGWATALGGVKTAADIARQAATPFFTLTNAGVNALRDLVTATDETGPGLVDYAAIAGEVSGAQALLNDEIEAARDLFFGYSTAAGEVAGAQALLNDEVENLEPWDRFGETVDRILGDAARLQEELDGLPAVVKAVGDAAGLSDDELLEFGAAFAQATEDAEAFRSITLELTDPIFAAAAAQERLAEATETVDDLTEAGISTGRDFAQAKLDQARAIAEAEATLRGLGQTSLIGSPLDTGIRVFADLLDITDEAAAGLLVDLGLLEETELGIEVAFLVEDPDLTGVPDEIIVGVRFQAVNEVIATQRPDAGGTLTQTAQTTAVAPIQINTNIIGATDTDIVGAAAQAGNVIAGVSGATQAFRGAG